MRREGANQRVTGWTATLGRALCQFYGSANPVVHPHDPALKCNMSTEPSAGLILNEPFSSAATIRPFFRST